MGWISENALILYVCLNDFILLFIIIMSRSFTISSKFIREHCKEGNPKTDPICICSWNSDLYFAKFWSLEICLQLKMEWKPFCFEILMTDNLQNQFFKPLYLTQNQQKTVYKTNLKNTLWLQVKILYKDEASMSVREKILTYSYLLTWSPCPYSLLQHSVFWIHELPDY